MSWQPLADILLRRGHLMAAENQHKNVRLARDRLAAIADKHEFRISHGKGPQVGPQAWWQFGNRVPFDKLAMPRLSVTEFDSGGSASEPGELRAESGRTFKPHGEQHAPRSATGAIGIDHGQALATDMLRGTRTQPNTTCSVR